MAEIKKRRKNREQRGLGLGLAGSKPFPTSFSEMSLPRCLFLGLGHTEQWALITLALLTFLLTGLELE